MFVIGGSLRVPPGTAPAGQQIRAVRQDGPLAGEGSRLGSLVRARRRGSQTWAGLVISRHRDRLPRPPPDQAGGSSPAKVPPIDRDVSL